MARKVIDLTEGVSVYDKDAGDYITVNELIIEGKGQKWNTFMKSLQDKIFTFISSLPTSSAKSENKDEAKDEGEMTAETIIGIVSISGNSAVLYEAIISSMKAYGTVNGVKCTDTILDSLSEEDSDAIYEGFITDFLSKKVIRQMKSMSK